MISDERAPIIKDYPTIQENIYATLKKQICLLERVPGAIMSATDIAKSMSLLMQRTISRTPVREAFIQLGKEGLVELRPKFGTIVTKIDRDRALEERYIRYTLENDNLNDFLKNVTEADFIVFEEIINKQKKANEEGKNLDYIELDNLFHHKQFYISGHVLCLDIITTYNSHYDRFRNLTTWDRNNVNRSIKQHEELILAFRKKDLFTAQELLKTHLGKLINEEKELYLKYPEYFLNDRVGGRRV